MSDHKNVADRPVEDGNGKTPDGNVRKSKFGAAADGWEAYNSWLDRVRQQSGPTSRQAVIAKALYSVSSYKNWADKAKDAFDKDG
jgi:hypothetical protein